MRTRDMYHKMLSGTKHNTAKVKILREIGTHNNRVIVFGNIIILVGIALVLEINHSFEQMKPTCPGTGFFILKYMYDFLKISGR